MTVRHRARAWPSTLRHRAPGETAEGCCLHTAPVLRRAGHPCCPTAAAGPSAGSRANSVTQWQNPMPCQRGRQAQDQAAGEPRGPGSLGTDWRLGEGTKQDEALAPGSCMQNAGWRAASKFSWAQPPA